MRDIYYEFVDLDSDESFRALGRSLGGVLRNRGLCFDNQLATGELIKIAPERGLWIRKWQFTVFQKILMRKIAPVGPGEKKFILIYLLNPAIFFLNSKGKKIATSGARNNIFLTSDVTMDFSVVPNQPFYVLDIAFTSSWLSEQLSDADPAFKDAFDEYITQHPEPIVIEPCCMQEYKILHELELSIVADSEDLLFIRSRVYSLLVSFFTKITNRNEAELIKSAVHYEQLMQAEKIIMQNIITPPSIRTIAAMVNMSTSSLLRQFKLLHGKSISEYCIERKMEIAKNMILENRGTIKKIALLLGYKQPSAFIEIFSKQNGCSPGSLKLIKN